MNFETFATFDFMPITITSQESPIHEKVWVKALRARIELQQSVFKDFRYGPFGSGLKWIKCIIATDYEVMDNSGLWSALCNSTDDTRRIFTVSNPIVELLGCKVNWHFQEESVIQYGDPNFPYASVTFPLMVDYCQYDEKSLRQATYYTDNTR